MTTMTALTKLMKRDVMLEPLQRRLGALPGLEVYERRALALPRLVQVDGDVAHD